MSKLRSPVILAAALALPLLPGSVSGRGPGALPPQEPHLKDSDLDDLGEAIREYIQARVERKEVGEAEAAVKEEMDDLGKKLEKATGNTDVLASPADLGRALWLSYDYDRQRTSKGKVEQQEYTAQAPFSKDEPLVYAVWAPSKYSPRSGSYAVILTIPDQGVEPTDHLIEKWIDPDIRDNVILAAPRMPEDTGKWSELVGKAHVMLLMRTICESYAVDFDRIFLAGRGLGVATALDLAEQFPDRFAGVIGRTGDAGETLADNFRCLPTFFAGGGAKVTAFSERIDELGYGNCTVRPEGNEADIWNWMQSHERNSYPSDVTLVPGNPFPKRAYWVEVPPTDSAERGRITASIDRATNTITVEGAGMVEFFLYFNDVLVDMDKPIRVIANGLESQDLMPRSRGETLAGIFSGTSDPGRVFVAKKRYALRPVASEGGEGE